ncbi:coiled-coil domain-containing protein [Desulfogranum mediterraneum]|uniref:hypothetical protein n=1 Tax=Desulfogranum mediterraneum TaxID=160661 RepID=UPI00041D7CB4|nr:hypothetical protein [Desulfogranum mediterraneum]
MNILGPARMILLRAGKYDYGEVELTNPLHLVGPNNIGKTSLISVLQFLYIDDQRSMHFSREMAETRKYYFPDQNSYVLFECLTPSGYQVVGVQGLGPIRSYEFKRFAYQGPYDPDDYLDEERRIREPEAVRLRLAAKEFRWLEPRHLQAALTGIGDNRNVNLGLVPIRLRDHYERFRAVFGNLLRLAHLRQDELKQFLLEIHRGEFQQRTIDLEAGYSSQYRKVCSEAEGLRDLRAIADDVRRILTLVDERDALQQLLPGLWEAVRAAYGEVEAEIVDNRQKIGERLARLDEDSARLGKEEQKHKGERDALLQGLGKIAGELQRHEQEAASFKEFLVDFEKSRKNELELKIDRLSASLGQAVDLSVDQLRRQVGRLERELATMQRRREQFSGNVASKVLPLLSDADAGQLFRLINPEILGLSNQDDGLSIKDEKALAAALGDFSGRIVDEVYEDELVRVPLAGLSRADLAGYRDAETLEQRIGEQQKVLKREQGILAAALNREQIRAEKEQLRKECDRISIRLQGYQDYQERLPTVEQWSREQDALEKEKQQLEAQLAELAGQGQMIAAERRKLEGRGRELGSRRKNLLRRVQKLSGPDPSWPVEPFDPEERDLDSLLELYERKHGLHADIAARFSEEFRRIEQRTYGKYLGEDEGATLANLQAEVEALDEREKAVQELWKSLAAGLQSAFKGLNRDLHTLSSRIDELNRRLAGISISNLSRLRLILREHAEWTQRIKTVVEVETMPLFFDSSAVGEAQNQLGELLKQHRRVELSDLFDLHFEVTSDGGQTRRYPHLDSIESNGTTITIKVLINLILLKGLLGDREVSIPFYLDEASSLDRENLAAIVREARKMGFIAVLASPEAMEAADSLYFLRENNGRIMLDPKTSLLRIERRAGDEA